VVPLCTAPSTCHIAPSFCSWTPPGNAPHGDARDSGLGGDGWGRGHWLARLGTRPHAASNRCVARSLCASAAIASIPADAAAARIPVDAAAVPTAASTVPAAAGTVPATDTAVSVTYPTGPAAATPVPPPAPPAPPTPPFPAPPPRPPLPPPPPCLFGWQPNASASVTALTAVFSTHLSVVPPFLTFDSPFPSTCTLTSTATRSLCPPCCTTLYSGGCDTSAGAGGHDGWWRGGGTARRGGAARRGTTVGAIPRQIGCEGPLFLALWNVPRLPVPLQNRAGTFNIFDWRPHQCGSQGMAIDWLAAVHVRNARQAFLTLNARLSNLLEWPLVGGDADRFDCFWTSETG